MSEDKNFVDLSEQHNKDAQTKRELTGAVVAAGNMAEWIFADVYYNCDGEAVERTAQRLRDIHENHGKPAMFGLTGYWAMRCYWKLQDAYKSRGIERQPDLLPIDTVKALEQGGDPVLARAYVSAQQFLATMTHDNVLMAKAIFDSAYDAGYEEFVPLMQNVLIFSLRTQKAAEQIKSGEMKLYDV